MKREHRLFIDIPWDVAEAGRVVFTTPKDENDWTATISVSQSEQLCLPYQKCEDVVSLEIAVKIYGSSSGRQAIWSRTVSAPMVSAELEWMKPDNLLKEGPERLITDAIMHDVCLMAAQERFDEDEDELFTFIRHLALLSCQPELAEHMLSHGLIDTATARCGGGMEGKAPVDPGAPCVFRFMDSGSKLEAEFVGHMGDALWCARHGAKHCGVDVSVLDDVLKDFPATSRTHSGYRFIGSTTNNPRWTDLWRLFRSIGIDDDRTVFYDQSDVCIECGGIIAWDYDNPGVDNAMFVEAEGYICRHCAQEESDSLSETDWTPDEVRSAFPGWLERCVYEAGQVPDRQVACCGGWVVPALEHAGYARIDGEFSNGIREGCNDSPAELAKQYDEKMGDQQYVFVVSDSGDPFETRFAIYARPVCDITE